MMKVKEFKEIVTRVMGPIEHWETNPRFIRFRASRDVTLANVTALSDALGTDAINFAFGTPREPGYSDITPSWGGTPGYIEVVWPIARRTT